MTKIVNEREYTLTIIIIGKEINQQCSIKYTSLDSLFETVELLNDFMKIINQINIFKLSFESSIYNPNIRKINKLSEQIIKTDFFINFCTLNKCKLLVYDTLLSDVRIYHLVLDNNDSYKEMDSHLPLITRVDHYEQRLKLADP
jgi:hypothetical protein